GARSSRRSTPIWPASRVAAEDLVARAAAGAVAETAASQAAVEASEAAVRRAVGESYFASHAGYWRTMSEGMRRQSEDADGQSRWPAPPGDAPVSGARRWAITVSVMMVTVMQVLDTSVTNVALPHMQGSLSAGVEEMSWVITSFLAANAVVIPATGW